MLKKWPCDPSFWRGFWSQNRPNIKKKWYRHGYKNQCDLSFDFLMILAPFWTSGHPKIHYFSLFFALGVDLEPSWGQEGRQSAPRQPQSSIFKDLGPSWRGFRSKFQQFPISLLIQNFKVSARWRLDARSALDICIHMASSPCQNPFFWINET